MNSRVFFVDRCGSIQQAECTDVVLCGGCRLRPENVFPTREEAEQEAVGRRARELQARIDMARKKLSEDLNRLDSAAHSLRVSLPEDARNTLDQLYAQAREARCREADLDVSKIRREAEQK